MLLRKLLLSDYYKGYYKLLKTLNNTSFNKFSASWYRYAENEFHHIYVLEDKNQIVGTGSILLEPKFIRNGAFSGHIEDIIISDNYNYNELSKIIVDKLKSIGQDHKCYRMLLNCNEPDVEKYKNHLFKRTTETMGYYNDNIFYFKLNGSEYDIGIQYANILKSNNFDTNILKNT